jgi:hypothetical protein
MEKFETSVLIFMHGTAEKGKERNKVRKRSNEAETKHERTNMESGWLMRL